MALAFIMLFLENSPLLYHVYISMTIFLWTRIFCNYQFLKELSRELCSRTFSSNTKLLTILVVAIFILEFLVCMINIHYFTCYHLIKKACELSSNNMLYFVQVASFFERKLYTWCFLIVGLLAAIFVVIFIPGKLFLAAYIWGACWFISLFTLMPAEIPDNNHLV